MRWLGRSAAAVFLVCVLSGQGHILSPIFNDANHAGGYIGPCDAVPGCSNAWSSTFAPTAAIASANDNMADWICPGGSPSSGTIKYVSTGGPDLTSGVNGTAAMATACGANANQTKNLYDIVGSKNATTGATGPQIFQTTNCSTGDIPTDFCLKFTTTPLTTASLGSGYNAQPYTIAAIIYSTSAVNGMLATNGSTVFFYVDSSNNSTINAGSAVADGAVSLNAQHHLIFVLNGASSSICVDGVRTTLSGSPGAATLGAAPTYEIGSDSFSDNYVGNIREEQLWNGLAMSAVDQGILWANAKTRYTNLSGAGTCS